MAIGTPVGTAFLNVKSELDAGFQAAIAGALAPIMGPVGIAAGVILGGGIAAGFAAFNIGETFDEAFDTIRIGTGAVGEELATLQADFKKVFSSVPADAGDVGAAVTAINQRLGLTGKPLQDLTAQFLELSRITETDVAGNIEGVTRLFGDWGIATEEQSGRLDQLFRAGQETGIGIDQLAGTLVKFGAPLRLLGFSFDEAAALVAKFEREGVNVDLALSGLRVGLSKMARAGEPAAETFRRVVAEIEAAGPGAEATGLAFELFGARAGSDMALAILEGRFAVGDLMATIAGGSDTIIKAGQDTQDFAEKWNVFKNRVLIALEPVATRVFEAIGNLIEMLAPKIEKWINDVLIPAIDKFAIWWDQNGAKVIDTAGKVFDWLVKGFGLVVNAINVVVGVISGIVQVIRGVVDVIIGIVTGDWKKAWEGVKNIVGGVFNAVASIIKGAIGQWLAMFGDFFRNATETVRPGIENIVKFFKEMPGKIWKFLKELPGRMLQLGKDMVAGILTGIGNIGTSLFNKLKEGISNAINSVKSFFGIRSASLFMIRNIGFPLGEGLIVGFDQAVDPADFLRTTERAVGAITAAARPTIGLPAFAGGTDGNLALASGGGFDGPAIGAVNFYDTREKPAEESLQEAGLRVAVMLNLRK